MTWRCGMTTPIPRRPGRPARAFTLLVTALAAMLAFHRGAGAIGLPPINPPPLPLPLPPLDLRLGPPQLPRIPSLPQVLPPNGPGPSSSRELPVTSAILDTKLLIVSADGSEPVLTAIQKVAEYAGIPYTLYIASRTP